MHLVAGGDRRVGREDDPFAYRAPRRREVLAPAHALRDELDAGEDRVPLVEVMRVDRHAELSERADAADPEEDLLREARVERRIVEALRDPGVALAHRLEQE